MKQKPNEESATNLEGIRNLNDLNAGWENPQAFMTETARLINRALHEMVVDGIKYELIKDQYYEMRLFSVALSLISMQ